MPTEADFESAARLLDAAAADAAALAAPLLVSIGPEVLAGGVLAESVDALVADGERESAAVAAELQEVAAECRRRAEIVRQLAADLAAYEAAAREYVATMGKLADPDADPGAPPVPHPGAPPDIPSWAEV